MRIQLEYKQPRSDGMPTREEFKMVGAIEDRLKATVLESGGDYPGRVTVGGSRYFYFFVNRAKLAEIITQETGYRLSLFVREDSDHSSYWDDLYPGPSDWQVIKDMRVIESLNEKGDDGTEARSVDHWVYFDHFEDAKRFIDWATNAGFNHEEKWSKLSKNEKCCVRLSRNTKINLQEITSHTIALNQKATEIGGNYDGWETKVCRKS